MLKSVSIENFQCHHEVAFDLEPGVNVIVGKTDIGKSAIIRAILWGLTNQPQGVSFIRKKAKPAVAQVTLEIDDTTIVRKRGKSINQYFVNDEEFVAFGTGVPKAITHSCFIDSVNISRQHEAAFWFPPVVSPGELAKRLNAIVDLSIIDDAQAYVARELREAKGEERVWTEETKQATETVRELKKWTKAIRAFSEIEKMDEANDKEEADCEYLSDLIGEYHSASDAALLHKERKEILAGIATLYDQYIEANDEFDEVDSLVKAAKKKTTTYDSAEIQRLASLLEKATADRNELKEQIRDARCKRKQAATARRDAEKIQKEQEPFCKTECPNCGEAISLQQ